jgi:hypothetical protein
MPVVDTTTPFSNNEQITSTKLNNIMDNSFFVSGAVVPSRGLEVTASGQLQVPNSGITTALLENGAVITEKIANSTSSTTGVTTAKIADSNVTQAKLGTNVAGNGPAFRAWASSQTPITGTVFTKVTLATEDFDTNNNFSSSRFTPTVAGYYQINGSVYNAAGTSFLQAVLYKNGAINSAGTGVGSAYISQSSDIIYLNGTTDYIELYGYSASTTNIDTGRDVTFMSGCLIRSA